MTEPSATYRYELDVEVPATEVAVLVDALEGKEFSLGERVGKEELLRQLEAQHIRIDIRCDRRLPGFEHDIETLSAFLSEPISGREICVEPRPGGPPLLSGSLILGRRGEARRVALELAWDAAAQSVVDRGVDMTEARRRWDELPEWVRASLATRSAGPSGA